MTKSFDQKKKIKTITLKALKIGSNKTVLTHHD